MSYSLTGKMKQLYDFIVAYTQEAGYSPSMDEMKDALGLASKSGIHRLVVALEERGKIQRLRHRARSVVIVDDNLFLRLPTELLFQLNAYATIAGVSNTEIITRAIVRELAKPVFAEAYP